MFLRRESGASHFRNLQLRYLMQSDKITVMQATSTEENTG
jgi:hypothetical protein